jgi:hypothetical protein
LKQPIDQSALLGRDEVSDLGRRQIAAPDRSLPGSGCNPEGLTGLTNRVP